MPRRKNSNFISIHTSLTPENHALLVKAAASMGMTLGDFLSVAALDKQDYARLIKQIDHILSLQ